MKNPFVSFIDRSYEQIVQSIKDKMPVFTPEMTDTSDANPYITFTKKWAGMVEMLGYYLDSKARESYITECKRVSSAVKLSRMFDYRIRGFIPASVELKFYFENPIPIDVLIPANTEVHTREGIPFFTLQGVLIVAGSKEATISAKQFVKINYTIVGTSNGSGKQRFLILLIPGTKGGVVDYEIKLRSGTDVYTQVDTFAFSTPLDKHIVAGLNENAQMEVVFGDNINGSIPNTGSILAEYYISEGLNGNVSPNTIVEIKSSIAGIPNGFVLKAINPIKASGGTNSESLADLKLRVPISYRTLRRAVTPQDHKDLAEVAPGVAKAGVLWQCGKTIDIYVVPQGGGLASPALLIDVEAYFNDGRKMITKTIRALAAGEIRLKIKAIVRAKPNYYNSSVKQKVLDRLINFGGIQFQEIKGSLNLGDVYEIIETTEGVQFSELENIVPIPYAKTISGSHTLIWEPEILVGSTETIRWLIQFNSITSFFVFKNNSFQGLKYISELIEFEAIKFKVLPGSYVQGDKFEFYSYRYSGSIQLEEYSVPIILSEDIFLIVTGGL